MRRSIVIPIVRSALIVSAVLADLFSLFLAYASLPEAGRNPGSPEFGALQWQWATAFAVTVLLMGAAILAASVTARRVLVTLLCVTLLFSAAPAAHLYKHRIKPRFGADAPAGVIASRATSWPRHCRVTSPAAGPATG